MHFLEDWSKIRAMGYSPYIDYETQNASFLKMAEYLQKRGVKNHYFMLGTINEELKGIDPWSKALTDLSETSTEVLKLRALVMDECIRNVWYLFREVYRLRVVGAPEKVRFRLNRGSCASIWLLENHIDIFLELPRQIGKSFVLAGILASDMGLRSNNNNFGVISKDRKLTGDFAKYMENYLTGLPNYLTFFKKLDKCNSEIITVKKLENQTHLFVCQSGTEEAQNVGRGFTLNCLVFDEANYQDNLDITLGVVSAAGNAAKANAKLNNGPYFTAIVSTAGDLNTKRGRFGRKLFDDSLPFSETLYDCRDAEDLKNSVQEANLIRLRATANDRGDDGESIKVAPTRCRVSYNYKALGLTDQWYEETKVQLNLTEERAQNELNNVWLKNSSGNVISPEESKMLNDNAKEPEYMEITEDGYVVSWYIPEEEVVRLNRQMVMGVDPSNALNGDSFPFTILDTDTAETLAVGFYRQTNLATLNEWFVKWFLRYPENFVMIIENRSTGAVLIDTLVRDLCARGINPLYKLYNWVVDEKDEKPKQAKVLEESNRSLGNLSFFAGIKGEIGFTTGSSNTRSSRDKLFSQALRHYLTNSADVCRDKTLISEWHTLTTKSGKIEAEKGCHDDGIVTLLLAYWFLLFAKNKHIYGLDMSRIMNKALYKKLGDKGVETFQRNQLLYQKLGEIKTMLNNATDDDEIVYYTTQLQKQAEKLGEKTETHTLDIDQKLEYLKRKSIEEKGKDKVDKLKALVGYLRR